MKTIILDGVEYQLVPVVRDADGWITWNGGECPVDYGTLVDVRYRDGEEMFSVPANKIDIRSERDAAYAFWENDGAYNDIVAYRLSEGT